MELWQFLSLSLTIGFVAASRSAAVAAVLLGNWAINTMLAVVTGSQYHWAAMACVDYISGLLILVICLSRWAIGIVILYAAEMVAHVAFGLSAGGAWPEYHYWYVLHYAAWGQAWLLLAWSAIDGGKVVRDRFDLAWFMGPVDAMRHRVGLFRRNRD